MGKCFAAAGVVLLVVLWLLWRQLDSSGDEPSKPVATASAVEPAKPAAPTAKVADVSPGATAEPAKDELVKKMDPDSDDFFYKHDEMVVPRLSRNAVKCIEGLAEKIDDRNKSVVLKFKQHVRNGKV